MGRQRIQFKLTNNTKYYIDDNLGDVINRAIDKFYSCCYSNGFNIGYMDYVRNEYIHHYMDTVRYIPSKLITNRVTIDSDMFEKMNILKSEYKKYSIRIIEYSLFYYYHIMPLEDRTYN